jgi:hypothetical protein
MLTVRGGKVEVDMVLLPFLLVVTFFLSKKSLRRRACLCFFSFAISSDVNPAFDNATFTGSFPSVTRSDAASSIRGDPFGAILDRVFSYREILRTMIHTFIRHLF